MTTGSLVWSRVNIAIASLDFAVVAWGISSGGSGTDIALMSGLGVLFAGWAIVDMVEHSRDHRAKADGGW